MLIAALPNGSGEAMLYERLLTLVPRQSRCAKRGVTSGDVRRKNAVRRHVLTGAVLLRSWTARLY